MDGPAEAASPPARQHAVVDEGEGAVPVLAGKLGASSSAWASAKRDWDSCGPGSPQETHGNQGGVLSWAGGTDFYGALSAFCQRQGLPPDAALRVLRDTREGREALAAVETGHLAQTDYEIILANLLGVSPDGFLGRALADLRPRQEVLDLIHDARDAGIHVGILSNSWGTGTYDPYDGYDLDRLVDAVVISDQVGLRKPDPSIYQLTAAKIGIPPEDCVFVDDTKANLPAASKLGMKGVHFTDAQSGVAEIRHLLDLA